MGATGEAVRRLTDFGYDPAWSPDGGEIVFVEARLGWGLCGRFRSQVVRATSHRGGKEPELVSQRSKDRR